MNNEVTIQEASTDVLFFASSLQSIDKDYYLTNNEFKILLKLIHYHNTNIKGKKNEFITWRNEQIAEHIFSPENSVKKTISILSSKNYINVSTKTIKENGSFKKRRSISINWVKFEEVFNIIKKLKLEPITSPVIKNKNKVEEQPIQPEIVQPESNNNEKNQEEMKRIANPQNEAQIWNNELCDLEDICVETNINKEETIEEEVQVEKDDRTLEEVLNDLIKVKRISYLQKLEVEDKIKNNTIINKKQLIDEYNKYVK